MIFNTSDFAYHGHPEPLAGPEGWTRKSIALYYYSATRPASKLTQEHGTLFLKRHEGKWRQSERESAKSIVRDLIHPLLLKGIRAIRKRAHRLEDFEGRPG